MIHYLYSIVWLWCWFFFGSNCRASSQLQPQVWLAAIFLFINIIAVHSISFAATTLSVWPTITWIGKILWPKQTCFAIFPIIFNVLSFEFQKKMFTWKYRKRWQREAFVRDRQFMNQLTIIVCVTASIKCKKNINMQTNGKRSNIQSIIVHWTFVCLFGWV